MTKSYDETFRSDPRAIESILAERAERYGSFQSVASLSQSIKSLIHSAEPMCPMDADMIESLEMIANKLARILNGDPTYSDSWRDVAGYASLVADRLDGVAR